MTDVVVNPDETADCIREYIRSNPDVRKDEYTSDEDPLHGSCYVASEAYFHAMGGTDSGLDIYCLSWSDVDADVSGTHWFLRRGKTVIDLSLPTPAYADGVPWGVARRRAFITGYEPSNRAKQILEVVNA